MRADKRVWSREWISSFILCVQNLVLITRWICAPVSVFETGSMLINPKRMYRHRKKQQQGHHNIVKPVMFKHQNDFLPVEVEENGTVWVEVSRVAIRVQFCTYKRGDRLLSHYEETNSPFCCLVFFFRCVTLIMWICWGENKKQGKAADHLVLKWMWTLCVCVCVCVCEHIQVSLCVSSGNSLNNILLPAARLPPPQVIILQN